MSRRCAAGLHAAAAAAEQGVATDPHVLGRACHRLARTAQRSLTTDAYWWSGGERRSELRAAAVSAAAALGADCPSAVTRLAEQEPAMLSEAELRMARRAAGEG
eukprot:TRINITY_DN37932_c0_g2_i1.p3 TRINITY_DN37932_c0_g2~~TRINITY_DN37932_c0_g2_i1.p3  ORF type:complete len:118 (+),score=28.41 TRINITY_DN37932_c0_g2_i1:44-355(+)